MRSALIALLLCLLLLPTAARAGDAPKKKAGASPSRAPAAEPRDKRELREDICAEWDKEQARWTSRGNDYDGPLGRLMDRWYDRYHEMLIHVHTQSAAEETAVLREHGYPAKAKVRTLPELCGHLPLLIR